MCNKLGHFARECKTPQHVIQKIKGTKAHGKDSQVRSDYKSRVPKCKIYEISGHKTKDRFHLMSERAAVASKARCRFRRRKAQQQQQRESKIYN